MLASIPLLLQELPPICIGLSEKSNYNGFLNAVRILLSDVDIIVLIYIFRLDLTATEIMKNSWKFYIRGLYRHCLNLDFISAGCSSRAETRGQVVGCLRIQSKFRFPLSLVYMYIGKESTTFLQCDHSDLVRPFARDRVIVASVVLIC